MKDIFVKLFSFFVRIVVAFIFVKMIQEVWNRISNLWTKRAIARREVVKHSPVSA
jgi:hypothetical protein